MYRPNDVVLFCRRNCVSKRQTNKAPVFGMVRHITIVPYFGGVPPENRCTSREPPERGEIHNIEIAAGES